MSLVYLDTSALAKCVRYLKADDQKILKLVANIFCKLEGEYRFDLKFEYSTFFNDFVRALKFCVQLCNNVKL